MPECPIEQAQKKIMQMMENGVAAPVLSGMYARDEVARAAIKSLVFMDIGMANRTLLINIVGELGLLQDIKDNLARLVCSSQERQGNEYSEKLAMKIGNRTFKYYADKEEAIRMQALGAIEKILERSEAPDPGFDAENALVKCAVTDPYSGVRKNSIKLITKYGGRRAFSLFFTYMQNAEKGGDDSLFCSFMDATYKMARLMEEGDARGSFLKAALGLSNSNEFMWDFSKTIIKRIYKGCGTTIQGEISRMVLREHSKLRGLGEREDRNFAIKRLGQLLRELEGEYARPPKKMRGRAAPGNGGNLPAQCRKLPGRG